MWSRVHPLLSVCVLVFTACGAGDETTDQSIVSMPPTTTESSSAATPSTAPSMTSSPVPSTTRLPPTTTSTSTSTSSPSTTTLLDGERTGLAILRSDGLGPVDLGTASDDVIETFSELLGPPDVDRVVYPPGEGEDGCVEGASWEDCLRDLRVLEQGRILGWTAHGLSVALTDSEWSGTERTRVPLQFSSWRTVQPLAGEPLTTAAGIGPGSGVGEIRRAYPNLVWYFNEGAWDGFGISIVDGGPGLYGHLDWEHEVNGYIRAIQRSLNSQGAQLVEDGEVGPATSAAWEQFCSDHGLSCSADWPDFPWFITEEQRAALNFPPDDVRIEALSV